MIASRTARSRPASHRATRATFAHAIPLRCMAYSAFPAAACGYAAVYTLALRTGPTNVVHALFWLCTGLALVAVQLLIRANCGPREGALIATSLGALFYLPKYFRSPHYFNFHDEYAHWYAAQELLAGHGLAVPNPDNLVVQYYPGLTAITAMISSMTGLPVYVAGNIVSVWAHMVTCLAVYGMCRQLRRSPAVALSATIIFGANPAFFYFDSQFAYETLAVAFFAVILLGAIHIAVPQTRLPWTEVVILAILIAALAVTHHATSYVLTASLVALAALSLIMRRKAYLTRRTSAQLTVLAAAAVTITGTWLLTLARYTFSYLGPLLAADVDGVRGLLASEGQTSRKLFATAVIPGYEITGSYLAVTVLFALYLWIITRIRRTDIRQDPRQWLLIILGGVYFASLPVVFSLNQPTAKRPWVFAFMGMAVAGAPLLHRVLTTRYRSLWLAGVALVAVSYIGGVVTMSGADIRFPAPYEAGSDTLAATPGVVAAADWLDARYGGGNPIIADETDAQIFGSYGRQDPRTYEYFGYEPWNVFFPRTLDSGVYSELQSDGARFIVVDLRIATQPPLPQGYYFNAVEPGANTGSRPFTIQSLEKFQYGPFDEIYNNGNVIIWQYLHWRNPSLGQGKARP
jgi:hypothetical protein